MNKNIVIIGATSGIGKALFENYAKDGNRLGIVGRRTNLLEGLREQYPANTLTATADITKTDEAEKAIRKRKSKVYVTKRWHVLAIINKNLPFGLYKRL